ncbi:unnamed protein product [Cunninghamella blakesleeana]
MPQYIPTYLIIRQCIKNGSRWIKTGLRAMLVAIVWLVLLPYVTLWTWRFYFWSSESLNQHSHQIGYNRSLTNSLFNHHQEHHQFNVSKNTIITTNTLLHYNFKEFLADCFEGQIITAILIIIVVAAYLFREWVIQNTPAEIDRDSEIEEEENVNIFDRNDNNIDLDSYDQQDLQQHETINNGNTNTNKSNNRLSINSMVKQQTAVDVLLYSLNDMKENREIREGDNDQAIKTSLKNIHDELGHNLTIYDSEDEEYVREQHQSNRSSVIINSNRSSLIINSNRNSKIINSHRNSMVMNNGNTTTFDFSLYDFHQEKQMNDEKKENNEINQNNNNDVVDDDDDDDEINKIMQGIMLQGSSTTSNNNNNNNNPEKQKQKMNSCLKNEFESAYEINKKMINNNSKVGSSPSLVKKNKNQELLYSHTNTWPKEEANIHIENLNISTNIQSRKKKPQQNPYDDHYYYHQEYDASLSASTSTSTTTTLHDKMPMHQASSSTSTSSSSSSSSSVMTTEATLHNNDPNMTNDHPQQQQNHHRNRNDFPLLGLEDNPIFNDDEPFDLVEDIDGVLEAIGMRGNPWLLLQNSVLVAVLIALCLGITVWIPCIVGRFIILFHPWKFLNMITFILRQVTDPLVDYFIDVCFPTVSPFIYAYVPKEIRVTGKTILKKITSITFNEKSSTSFFISPLLETNDSLYSSSTFTSSSTLLYHLMNEMKKMGNYCIQRWYQFALGNTILDRGACTLLGYITLLCIGSWYLTRHREDSSFHRATNDGIKEIIRQQVIFFKVFTFISLELVLLPIICGVLLDISTLPLIENASMQSRWQFMKDHFYSSGFLHWFIGTGFMFHFSVFVTLCRENVRPGVLWFIRDPNDPEFHPVQEIMERPLLLLLRKICTGALMYLTLIIIGMGTVTYAVGQYTGIYPLRLTFNEPLSVLAIDILIAQFLIPLAISYLKPREFAKQLLSLWWRMTSKHLRLSSFMFGDRYVEEEGTFIRKSFKSWLFLETCPLTTDTSHEQVTLKKTNENVLFQKDGYLARVPKRDSIMVKPQRRMIVPVDPLTLEPIDPIEKELGHPAVDKNTIDGEEEHSTTIVYIPPHFKLRVAIFLFAMWFTSSVITCSITAVPLLLGRYIFESYITPTKQVHDIYTFVLGAFIMILLSISINWMAKGLEAFKKNKYAINYYQLKNHLQIKLIMGFKLIYLIISFGWMIPLLFGVMIDLYIYLPLRQDAVTHDHPIVIHLTEDWSYGIIAMSILYGMVYMLPIHPSWQRDLDQFMEDGLLLSSLNVKVLTQQKIGPLFCFMSIAIFFPGGLAWTSIHFLNIQDPSMKLFIFRCAYPILFCLVFALSLILLGMKLIKFWVNTVRDDTYLVGRQLHNLDEPAYHHYHPMNTI